MACFLSGRILLRQGPRCSLRSKKMYSDAYPDYLRMTALNVPAALLVLGALFSVDDITGASHSLPLGSCLRRPCPAHLCVVACVCWLDSSADPAAHVECPSSAQPSRLT